MRVQLEIDGATTAEVRTVSAALSRYRDRIGTDGTGHHAVWAPRVHCDGSDRWHLYSAPVPADVAAAILAELTSI